MTTFLYALSSLGSKQHITVSALNTLPGIYHISSAVNMTLALRADDIDTITSMLAACQGVCIVATEG